jgi:hypothetical protein
MRNPIASYTDSTRLDFMRAGTAGLLDGQIFMAEALLKTALSLVEQAEALSHPNVGECLVHLGNIKMSQQQPVEAESLFNLATFVFRQAFGKEHVNVRLAAARASQARSAQKSAQTLAHKEPENHRATPGQSAKNLRYLPSIYRAGAVQLAPYAAQRTAVLPAKDLTA